MSEKDLASLVYRRERWRADVEFLQEAGAELMKACASRAPIIFDGREVEVMSIEAESGRALLIRASLEEISK